MMLPYIEGISSVNLRLSRGAEKKLDDPIGFECSYCERKLRLGKTTPVMVRIDYQLKRGKVKEKFLCAKCIDVFADLLRFGPKVVEEAHRWKLCSQVARVSVVHEFLECGECLEKSDSHVFLKLDDLKTVDYDDNGGRKYRSVRFCANCASVYLEMMEGKRVTALKENKFDSIIVVEGHGV